MTTETIHWYPWENEHATRTLINNADNRMRVICRCGFRSHWYNSEETLHEAVNRHSQKVILQKVS